MLGFDLHSGHRILFLLEDPAFKYTPSYDEVKISSLLRFKNLNFNNLFEYDSNVLPNSQSFRFVFYRINLHISPCLTKKEKWQNNAHR